MEATMQSLKSACGFGFFVGSLVLAGCGSSQQTHFDYNTRATARAPEADATITADLHLDQSNTSLAVHIEHLAEPDRIAPGSRSYVAWFRRDPNLPWNPIGALAYDAAAHTGVLNGTAAATAFDFEVSAETSATPEMPSSTVVLYQHVGGGAAGGPSAGQTAATPSSGGTTTTTTSAGTAAPAP